MVVEVARRYKLTQPVASEIVSLVLGAAQLEVATIPDAVGRHSDLGMAARTVALRLQVAAARALNRADD